MSPKQIGALRKIRYELRKLLKESGHSAQLWRGEVETGRNQPKGAYWKALEAIAGKTKSENRAGRKQSIAAGDLG